MAEDKDPFAEFGGSKIVDDKDPFAEFGGSKLRGKPSNTVAPTTSQPLSTGSKPFQTQVDTKVPSVLTEKGATEYKEQVKSYVPPVQKQPKLPKEKPLSNLESIKNTVYNVANSLKGVLPRLSLTSVDVFEKVIGKDLTGRLTSLPRIEFSSDGIDIVTGRTPEQIRNESLQSLDYLGTKTKPTAGIVENARNFNVPGLAAGVVDAAGGLVSTIIPSALSGGSLLVTEMVGGGLYDYNKAKAKAKGVSTEELYKRGDADFGVPASIGGVGYAMEKIGLKGFTNAISKKLVGSGFKKALLLGTEWNKEGLTEWVQVGLDEANLALANGLSVEDAVEAATDKMTSVQGLEAYAKGFAGSAAASGVARAAKRLVSPKNKAKVSELEQQKNQAMQDLANDNIAPEAKDAILEVLENTNEQIDDLVNIDIKETDNLDDNQKVKVSEINSKIEGINAAIENENTSESTKSILEKQKQELESELDTIIGEVKVPKAPQPRIETEEDIIKEIRAAEKEFNETGDAADYQLKINDLNQRLENLVPEPEVEGEDIAKEDVEAPQRERGSHKIVKSEDNTTLDDMTKGGELVPDDFYDKPQFYTDINNKASKESLSVIKKAKGNPDAEITIYRSVPQGVENIEEGDWISLSPTYAKEHGMHPTDETQDMPVISMKVKAKDIVWDGNDVNEFAYFPVSKPTKPQTDAIPQSKPSQVPVQPEAPTSQEVEQGKPEAKVEGVTQEGKQEEVAPAQQVEQPKAEVAPAKPKSTQKLKVKTDTKLKVNAISDLDNKIKAEKGRAKKAKLEADRRKLLEKTPSIGYVYDNLKNVVEQLTKNGLLSKDGKKIVYEGKAYAENDFVGVLHDGLLDKMVQDGTIDETQLTKKPEMVERTEFDDPEDAELYEISRETDPNVIAAKYFTLPTAEDTNFKDYQIMEYLGSKGKIKEKDWREYGDINDASLGIRKRYIDFTNKKAMGLDGQAEELQDQIGMPVEPADFLNVILEYGNLEGFKIKSRSNVEQALLERYNDLTGKMTIPNSVAKKAFETVNKKSELERKAFVSKERLEEVGVTEEDIARQKEFEESGFGELETPLEKFKFKEKQVKREGKGKSEIELLKEKAARAKELVANIRALKIDGKGNAFDATLGLPVAIWNGAIETVASAIEGGVALADAIKRGLNYIQKNNRGAWNKKAYNDRVIKELGLRGIEVNGTDLIVEPLEDKATVELVNGFYSPLEKGIAEAKTEKATGKGWMKVLSGTTEKDELNFTGVADFLNSNSDRPISKKELSDFMAKNRIEVVEVVKGGDQDYTERLKEIEDELTRKGYSLETDMGGDGIMLVDKEGELVEYDEIPPDVLSIYQEYIEKSDSNFNPDSAVNGKFEQYQLEGEKENYKEVLVTLPNRVSGFKKKTYERAMDLVKAIRYKELPDAQLKEIIRNEYGITEDIVKRVRESDNSPAELNDALTTIKKAEKSELTELSSKDFKSSHFDEPNILVHLRMNTRTDAEGNKVLLLEEVQSDWGQTGKREGFKEDVSQKEKDDLIFAIKRTIEEQNKNEKDSYSYNRLEETANNLRKRLRDLQDKESKTPSAPFVTDTNAWTKLGLKTALKEAVKQGADKLAWTTGEQQNDRYDLSKSVDFIEYSKAKDGQYNLSIKIKGGNEETYKLKENELEGFVGKEVAQKIINNEGYESDAPDTRVLLDKDLKVGGKGMKGFYGSPKEGSLGIVGNVAKSLFGQEPKTIKIQTEKQIENNNYENNIAIATKGNETYKLYYDSPNKEYVAALYDKDSDESIDIVDIGYHNTESEALNAFKKKFPNAETIGSYAKKLLSTQYSIDITPELKQAVKEGLPLFKNELTQAKEKVKEAKEKLNKLNRNLGIAADPEQNARALFEYHKALVGLAKAYLKEGVNSIKDFANEIGESVNKEVKDAWNEAKNGVKKTLAEFIAEADTSLVNEEVKLKRDIYGFDEPLPKTIKPNPELLDEARERIENGDSVYAIIDKIKDGEPITDVESVMLAQFQGTKEAELYKINKKIEAGKDSSPLDFEKNLQKKNEIIDDLISAYNASELSGTVAGRALQARKVRVLQDYSLANMIARTRRANNNRPLSREQFEEVNDKFNALVEAEAKLKEKIAKLEAENEKLRLKKSEARLRTEAAKDSRNRNRAEVKEALKNERSSIIEEMNKILKKKRGELSINPIPVEMFPLVSKLAKNYFVDGTTSIEGIVDNIYNDIKDLVDGVTKRDVRDAISGYGKDSRPTQTDLQKELYDLREQAKLISRIEDAEAGIKKAKTDRARRVASDEVQKLRARLKDLTKGDDSLEALKARLKRNIQETKRKLDTKDYSKPEKFEVELDDEARRLQDAYRKIKFDFDVAVEKEKLANRTTSEKYTDIAIDVMNVPRALMATADLSAPLRQGLLPTISNPVMASKSFVEMLKQWGDKDRAERWLADLKDSPGYQLMQMSGLYIADRTNARVVAKEEDFQSNLAEKIPIAGKLVSASERAYVAYLNKMRADLFEQGVKVLQNDGQSFTTNPKAYKALADYINASTGRGSLGKLNSAAPILNAAFFSPRLMASRIQLLTNWANPSFYKNTPPAVRKMYFKDMGAFIAFGTGILVLSSLGGADVEDDPRSPDFGKIRSGNTRWDIWGGFQQFVRYAAQVASGEKKSTASGKITALDGTSYTKETRMSVIWNLIRSKLAPVPSAIVDFMSGGNMVGDPFDFQNTLITRVTPLVWQGLYESAQQDGWAKAIVTTGIPSILGVGVQTYGLNDFLKQGVDEKAIKLLIDKKAVAIEPKENERTVYDAVTGEKRKMTDSEFETYFSEWASYIKKDLKENYDKYQKMSPAKFEDEFRKIKSQATASAKEKVTGVIPETLKMEIDGDSYKLYPEVVAERRELIDEFMEKIGSSSKFTKKIDKMIEEGDIDDTDSDIERVLMKEAKGEATREIKKRYNKRFDELGVIED